MIIQPLWTRYQAFRKIGFSIWLTLFLIGTAPLALAESDPPPQQPPNDGLPPGTVGGGSRGGGQQCGTQEPLLALLPPSGILETTESYPRLWFYIPAHVHMSDAELILYDENDTLLVDASFSVAAHRGRILGVDLAHMGLGQPLQINRRYRWFFSLVCSDDRAADLVVDGWIQPTSASFELARRQLQRSVTLIR